MTERVRELCRRLKPVLGRKVDQLWATYQADHAADSRADVEQSLEHLAAKHLGIDYQPDRQPFPPPTEEFSARGDIDLGKVLYGNRQRWPFQITSQRLKEHLLVCGRSGSGKTNLTFVLAQGLMQRGIKVLALDWKRGYRDLRQLRPDLRVYTVGRDVSAFRFNPLIPPPGCEPHVWIKLIVDVIAGAYFGGEGVISLLVRGLDHLYRQSETSDSRPRQWPQVTELLAWLHTTKLTGRAAMWKASAERILQAMCYGEYANVVNTDDNRHVERLLDDNVVLELDGLSSASDRNMFSEALMLYLYRTRLHRGPSEALTNMIILEEAHHLLLAKQAGARESFLESAIRLVRQYGLGFVFVDQSASMLSKVAFANSYGMIALSQKLASDIRAMAGAMNLNDEQKEALSTLPVGTAVVRLADEHPEPFLVSVPRCPVTEGTVDDATIRQHGQRWVIDAAIDAACSYTHSAAIPRAAAPGPPVTPVSLPDKSINQAGSPPTIPDQSTFHVTSTSPPPPTDDRHSGNPPTPALDQPDQDLGLTREAIRFLSDVAQRPLSTTVERYQRLRFSRRRGNAIRHQLRDAGFIEAVSLATRSGQVVLHDLTDEGRQICQRLGIILPPRGHQSLAHAYWIDRAADYYRDRDYEVACERAVEDNGIVDLWAETANERLAIEVETGCSDIEGNLRKLAGKGFDAIIVIATGPEAVTACQKAIRTVSTNIATPVRLRTWLDIS